MNYEAIKQDFGIEIYRLDNATRNDWYLYFTKGNHLYRDITLSKIFDILCHREPLKFHNYFGVGKLPNTKKETIIIDIANNRDFVYNSFRNFLDVVQINIEGVTFKPTNERIINNKLNIFKPRGKFKELKPDISKGGKSPHIEKIMRNILQEGYEHFTHFMAWKLQHPCEIIPNHWIIRDDGGTGKTELLVSAILDKLFTINILGQDDLASGFTGYMQNTTMLVFEEIEGFDNQKKVKMITGAKYITINEKFRTPFRVENYNNCIFLSNDLKSLKIDDKDRRFNVVGGGKRLVATTNIGWDRCLFKSEEDNQKFFDGWHKHFDSELNNFYQYLMALKLDRNKTQKILDTREKKELEGINYSSDYEFLYEIKDMGFKSFVDEYSFKPDYFFKTAIVKIDNKVRKGYFVSIKNIYDLYLDFCKASGLNRPISKNHLTRRLRVIESYKDIFSDSTQIHIDDKGNIKALEIYNFINENDETGVVTHDVQ